jgi:fructose-bisphosphate aldolase class I
VDKGAKAMALFPGEKITEGLDGLRGRLKEYRELGARFTKWRGVIVIDQQIPSHGCLSANAHALARFAALSQEAGLVPIVEPEVLMDGLHTLATCQEVTERTLRLVFAALAEQRVSLEQMLLKPNMVIAGSACPQSASIPEVAAATLLTLRRTVPPAVPGVVFLSGGQNDVLATEHLNAMNQLDRAPWELSFSYGRALQDAALKAWNGSNATAGQQAFYSRAKWNALARSGKFVPQ